MAGLQRVKRAGSRRSAVGHRAVSSPRALAHDRDESGIRTCEGQVGDPAGRRNGLDGVVLFEAFQSVPQADTSAEQDRDDHEVHVVDEPGSKEVADHGGTTTDAYVLAVGCVTSGLERVARRSVDEVERRTSLHLDRRAGVVREDEGRGVERRVRTPPALPLRLLVPSGRPGLPSTPDLGAVPWAVSLGEGVVDAATTAGLADHLAPKSGGEHPLVQPLARVAKGFLEALPFSGAEAVERDGEVVDAGE